MWKNSFTDGNTGTVEIFKLYNVNKNPKNTLLLSPGEMQKHKGMANETNPHLPTSFLLLVPLPSASYLLHDNNSK